MCHPSLQVSSCNQASSQHGSVGTPTGASLPQADVEEGGQSKWEKKFKALAQDS